MHSYYTRKHFSKVYLGGFKSKTNISHMKIVLFNKLPKASYMVSQVRLKKYISKWLKDNAFNKIDDYLEFRWQSVSSEF